MRDPDGQERQMAMYETRGRKGRGRTHSLLSLGLLGKNGLGHAWELHGLGGLELFLLLRLHLGGG